MVDSSNNIGVKISQIGWDVKTAGDANLYFSSSWPQLKIKETDVVTVGQQGITLNHGLGYPPLVLAWNPQDGLIPCIVSNNTFTISIATINGIVGGRTRYFIFYLPLNKSYQSPVIRSPLEISGTIDHNFGLKFAKDGKDINSTDFRDYTLHSSTRSPLLHAVIYSPLNAIKGGDFDGINGIKWKPDLPYRPVYFTYYSSDGNTFLPISTISQTPPKVNYDSVDGGIVLNASARTGYGTILLLKDPIDSSSITEIIL